jgi:hypothetical protein
MELLIMKKEIIWVKKISQLVKKTINIKIKQAKASRQLMRKLRFTHKHIEP